MLSGSEKLKLVSSGVIVSLPHTSPQIPCQFTNHQMDFKDIAKRVKAKFWMENIRHLSLPPLKVS